MKKHTTIVYLIHFSSKLGNPDNPRGQAGHYVGQAVDLAARLERHRIGNGSAIMAAVARAGISWVCVRTWEDGTSEQEIKAQKNAPRLCPVCRGEVELPAPRVVGKRVPMTQRPISR